MNHTMVDSNPNIGKKDPNSTLDKFAENLVLKAKRSEIDPIIGRETEIKRLVQILSRKKKCNVIMLGDPGVGKTAIIEGLAIKIAEGLVPDNIVDMELYALDLSAMIAGTKFRGDFEERVKMLLDEIKERKNIILFVDEVHTIMGMGNAANGLDLANVLKPLLTGGLLKMIGATTLEEYKKTIAKDGALVRRFQRITVEEPTLDQVKQILTNIKSSYESHHNVIYSNEVLDVIVSLSHRYINRKFPDKAIDVLDELGARNRTITPLPVEISDLEKEASNYQYLMKLSTKEQDWNKATEYRDLHKKAQVKLTEEYHKFKSNLQNVFKPIEITINDVEKVITDMTGIPIFSQKDRDLELLKNINVKLKTDVIGQDKIVDVVGSYIKRNFFGASDSGKPTGSFMFLGSTGIGKTELAKSVAKHIFGSEKRLIRIDLSEYTTNGSATRLTGAPPSFVGYEEGGELTEKVKNNPYSVVLFDEIEKAHPSVFNVLLNILDEGYVTDTFGVEVSFKNCIIVMTSNLGLSEVAQFGSGVGFNKAGDVSEFEKNEIINKHLKNKFKPEFLNRIDEILIFNSLDEENILKITNLNLNRTASKFSSLGTVISFTEALINHIAKIGYNKNYGARFLKRIIVKEIENRIVDFLIDTPSDKLTIDYNTDFILTAK